MKKILWSFLGAFLFLGMPFWAGAQEEIIIPSEDMVIIAQVELYDAEIISQEENNFKLAFRLVNEGDIQPQIKYMIQLTDKDDQRVIHTRVYDEVITLGKGQSLDKEINYEAPVGLNGAYNIHINVSNQKGLGLALGGFGQVNLSGEGMISFESCYLDIAGQQFNLNEGVDIDAKTEQPVLKCDAFNESDKDISANARIEIRERSPFGVAVKKENLDTQVFKAGEKTSLTYNLFLPEKPQAYDGELVLVSGDKIVSSSVPLHYVIRGDSATIQNISLDKDDYQMGEMMKISLMIAGDADDFPGAREEVRERESEKLSVDVSVSNDEGKKCAADKNFPIDQKKIINNFDLKVEEDCQNAEIAVKLKNSAGKILDENTFSLRTVKETSNPSEEKENNSSSLLNLFLTFGIILVLATIAVVMMKNKGNSAKIFIFFILFGMVTVFSGVKEVSALTLGGSVNNLGMIEPFVVTYSLSSNSVNIGDVVTAKSQLDWSGCNNAYRQSDNSFRLDSSAWTKIDSETINSPSGHLWETMEFSEKSHKFTISSAGEHTVYFKINLRRYYPSFYDNSKSDDGDYVCMRCDQDTKFNAISAKKDSCSCYDYLGTWIGSAKLTAKASAINGACGTRSNNYSAKTNTWPATDTWCKYAGTESGVPTTFPAHGAYSATWTCKGLNGGDSVTNCKTGHIAPSPSVDLKVNNSNGPVSVNKDISSTMNMSWIVTKGTTSASAKTICEKSGNSWGTGQLIPDKSLNGNENIGLPGAPYPKESVSYQLTCHNAGADVTLNSQEVSDKVLVSVACNEDIKWTCPEKVCGDSITVDTYKVNKNCTESKDGTKLCEYPNCPIGSDWKEVRP